MRKKFLAFLLGGVVAACSFLQAPATVQASEVVDDLKSDGWKEWAASKDYCSGLSDAHIRSSAVTLVNGYLTVTLQVEFPDKPSGADYGYGGAVYVCEEQWQPTANTGGSDTEYYDYLALASEDTSKKYFNECDGGNYDGEGTFTLTFDELTSGKTYYVYCYVYDTHGWGEKETYGLHWAVYLGSETPAASADSSSGSSSSGSNSSESNSSGSGSSESTPSDSGSSGSNSSDSSSSGSSSSESTSSDSSSSVNASSDSDSQSSWTAYEEAVTGEIRTAESGSTIVMDAGITTLSNAMMKELLKKDDVSLKLEYTYAGKDYVVIIPAGAALDNDIPWYGPLYLAAHFGNSLETAEPAAGEAYTVKSGDTMSKIAAANNMTLRELLIKNPQIKDADKIAVGQKINR